MSKPYVRKRGSFTTGNIHTFTCTKCLEKFNSKFEFKKHYREATDHDQRKIK